MHLTDIVWPHQPRKYSRTLYCHVVVKQLHLNVRTQNTIVAVANRVHNKLRPAELRVLLIGAETSICSQICMFPNLCLHKSQHIVCKFKYRSCENLVLYHIHFCTHHRLCTLIADHTYSGPLKEPLWILAKKQQCGAARSLILLSTIVNLFYHITIFTQISLGPLLVVNQFHVIIHQRQIQVSPTGIVYRCILIIVLTLGIHQLHPLLKSQFLRFVTHTVIHLVGLVGMHTHALRHVHDNDMVRVAFTVGYIHILRRYGNRRDAIVIRCPQQFIHIFCLVINAGQFTVILHAQGNLSAIGIGKCDDCNGQSLGINPCALSVKHLKLCGMLYVFDCHILIFSSCKNTKFIPYSWKKDDTQKGWTPLWNPAFTLSLWQQPYQQYQCDNRQQYEEKPLQPLNY